MDTTAYEMDLIDKIADRAVVMAAKYGIEYKRITAVMDLMSTHESIPLRLHELLEADDGNFSHDVFGIRQHLDRSTFPGTLTGCFLPRFALNQTTKGVQAHG